jgi:hypothetical protein
MRVSLNELLALVGRLDDAPGFDTPRERFRRFLFERVTDAAVARSLVEQSQHSLGEQHRRALQDAIVVLGRFLGFETTFGTYQRVAGAVKYDGQWRSRHRLEIVIEIRADQTPRTDVDDLSRSLSALLAPSYLETDVRRLGLCVVTSLYGGRARLEDPPAGEKSQADIRIVSVRSLLWLADAVSGGHLKHEEILRLLTSGGNLDFVVDLMERLTTNGDNAAELRTSSQISSQIATPAPHAEPAYWVATIEGDEATSPEQFVESVIRKRQLLGLSDLGPAQLGPRAGDWICFSLRGKGIVGRGRVDSLADGPGVLRGAHRFSLVFTLQNVEIYETPVAFGPYAGNGRIIDRTHADGAGSSLAAVSPEEFAELAPRLAEAGPEGLRPTG